MKKISNCMVPFDGKGNQMHYPEWTWVDGKPTDPAMRPNEPFFDTLEYQSYSRGRSAAYFVFRRQVAGVNVVVFMSDMDDLIPRMTNGRITGTFRHLKRGQNFGTTLLEQA